MSDLQVLQKARAMIAAGWTQGWSARDADGRTIGLFDQSHCSFCLLGALGVANKLVHTFAGDWTDRLSELLGFEDAVEVVRWNDDPSRTQQQVVDLLDNKIKELCSATSHRTERASR